MLLIQGIEIKHIQQLERFMDRSIEAVKTESET